MATIRLLVPLLTLLLCAEGQAAQSYDSCKGFIDALPATISTQGTWCLRRDLSTAMTSGAAITVNTNNVTIDCNDFKIGGLAAGNDSQAVAIYAENYRHNVTVRHCNVRGFAVGILFSTGGSGHLVEDNRLDNNLYNGILVYGVLNLVQRNRVYDTGGGYGSNSNTGIYAFADVIDNTVDRVFARGDNTYPRGIVIGGYGSEARGNRVRGLLPAGSGNAVGIYVVEPNVTVDGNRISTYTMTQGWGIYGATQTLCTHNTVINFTDYGSCTAGLDNL